MREHIARGVRRHGVLVALSLPLTLLLAGCAPIGVETLQEFTADFARSALAAWLL